MKARLILAALFGLLILLPQQATNAQSPQSKIVVVDVAQVYKSHNTFNAELEAMKQDVEAFKASIQRETQRLQQLSEDLKRFDPNSDDYKRREEELSTDTAKLGVFRNQKNREFLEREARLYFDTYIGINRQMSSIADEYGITLVLRVDNNVPDAKDRQSVLQAVNRNIVYKQPQTDYTAMLIERVNR